MALALKSLQIWTAMVPRPPPAPQTSTKSPGRIFARVTSIRQAVKRTSGIDAACSQPRPFGFGTTLKAGTFAYSAWAPSSGPVWKPQILN